MATASVALALKSTFNFANVGAPDLKAVSINNKYSISYTL